MCRGNDSLRVIFTALCFLLILQIICLLYHRLDRRKANGKQMKLFLAIIIFLLPSISFGVESEEHYKLMLTDITQLERRLLEIEKAQIALSATAVSNEVVYRDIANLKYQLDRLKADLMSNDDGTRIKTMESTLSDIQKNIKELDRLKLRDEIETYFDSKKGKLMETITTKDQLVREQAISTARDKTLDIVGFFVTMIGAILAGSAFLLRYLIVRWLKDLRRKIEKDLGEEIRKNKELSESALHEAEESVKISQAFAAVGPHATVTERVEAVRVFNRLLSEQPKNRTFSILLGRMLRKDKNYDQAIQVLSNFAKAIEKDPDRKNDLADTLYNISCYKVLKALDQFSPDTVGYSSSLSDGIDILKQSIELKPDNRKDAEKDEDFEGIRGTYEPYDKLFR